MGVFNKNLLGIVRIGPLNWTIRILIGIYCGFWKCGFLMVGEEEILAGRMDGFCSNWIGEWGFGGGFLVSVQINHLRSNSKSRCVATVFSAPYPKKSDKYVFVCLFAFILWACYHVGVKKNGPTQRARTFTVVP